MLEKRKHLNEKLYQYDAFDNYLEYGCFTDQFLSGMDQYGGPDDLIAYEECPEFGVYENIRRVESLKHSMNAQYLRHVNITKKIFVDNIEIQQDLGLYGVINYDLDSWIEHVKIFYITLLSNGEVYDLIQENGLDLEEIEGAIEMMIQLEEYIIENIKEKENEIWN